MSLDLINSDMLDCSPFVDEYSYFSIKPKTGKPTNKSYAPHVVGVTTNNPVISNAGSVTPNYPVISNAGSVTPNNPVNTYVGNVVPTTNNPVVNRIIKPPTGTTIFGGGASHPAISVVNKRPPIGNPVVVVAPPAAVIPDIYPSDINVAPTITTPVGTTTTTTTTTTANPIGSMGGAMGGGAMGGAMGGGGASGGASSGNEGGDEGTSDEKGTDEGASDEGKGADKTKMADAVAVAPSEETPFYKSYWFWGLLAGGVAGYFYAKNKGKGLVQVGLIGAGIGGAVGFGVEKVFGKKFVGTTITTPSGTTATTTETTTGEAPAEQSDVPAEQSDTTTTE